jgi:phage FluMu protein Com
MIEVRCPKCGKLLFRAESMASAIETKCDRCKTLVRWPSEQPEIIGRERPSGTVGPEEVKSVK